MGFFQRGFFVIWVCWRGVGEGLGLGFGQGLGRGWGGSGEGLGSVWLSILQNPVEKPCLRSFDERGACKSRNQVEYCFESTVSEDGTHWVLWQTRWVLSKTPWVRFCKQILGREVLTELSPQNSVRAKKTHWALCLKPCSPKPNSPVSITGGFCHYVFMKVCVEGVEVTRAECQECPSRFYIKEQR